MAFDFARLKESFFDSEKVSKAVSRGKRRLLSKCGAFVRRRAKSSIRKRKKSSPPGQPPSSHSGEVRKLIFFAWDQRTETVVSGPVPFGQSTQDHRAPEALEHAGPVTRRTKSGESKVYHYRGNPFMKPALEAEMPKFVSQFKDLL